MNLAIKAPEVKRKKRGPWDPYSESQVKVIERVLRLYPEEVTRLVLAEGMCDAREIFDELFRNKIREIELLFAGKLPGDIGFSIEMPRRYLPSRGYLMEIKRSIGASSDDAYRITLNRFYTKRSSRRGRFYPLATCPFLRPKVWFLRNFKQIKQTFSEVANQIG
jgi:hypothetical protein